MPEFALVLRDVDAVLAQGRSRVDIGIDQAGHIAAIGLARTFLGRLTIEGSGLIALPGGVDLHVHINTYFGGTTTRDDFFSGTTAALHGGTTTIAQFAIPRPGETSLQAITRTLAEARPHAVSDYVIHGALVRDTYDQSLAELPRLPDAGVRTLKVFSAYTDAIGLSIGQIHKVLRRAAESGVTVFVHAETDSLVREGIADAVERVGIGPRGHAASRTPLAENDAVRSLCDLARDTGATVYFVHISSAPSIDTLTDRRRQGDHILAETCPHYLFLDESVYAGTAGERWICSPPIRSAEHRAALWKGLLAGVIDTISSDHNCYDMAQKQVSADFRQVPNGLPGIEYRLPLLIDAAIRQELPWRRLAEVTAETPARILGLWPRKGSICIGGDADIVLVDPTAHTDLSAGHMATDYSPYAGTRAAGRVVKVYRRGLLVADETGVVAPRGSGEWLPLTVGPLMGERARLTGAPPN